MEINHQLPNEKPQQLGDQQRVGFMNGQPKDAGSNVNAGSKDNLSFDTNAFKGNWSKIKTDVQKAWSRITPAELDHTNGDVMAVRGLIQQKYGKAMDQNDRRLQEIAKRYEGGTANKTASTSSFNEPSKW